MKNIICIMAQNSRLKIFTEVLKQFIQFCTFLVDTVNIDVIFDSKLN